MAASQAGAAGAETFSRTVDPLSRFNGLVWLQ